MKISIIVPIFNEEITVGKILPRIISQKNIFEIIVVDDGSTDSTPKILKKLNQKKDFKKILKIITHKSNHGKGYAIRTGMAIANGDYILIQDGDLEYDPQDYTKLTKFITSDNCVFGSRILAKNPYAYLRTYFGNRVVTALCNFLFSSHLTDVYTCFKLIPRKFIKQMRLKSTGFEIETEITAKLLKNKIKITETAISYHPRNYQNGKKIKTIDAVKGVLKLIQVRISD